MCTLQTCFMRLSGLPSKVVGGVTENADLCAMKCRPVCIRLPTGQQSNAHQVHFSESKLKDRCVLIV